MPNPISKKLLLSKWTATKPRNQEKHFLVSQIHDPMLATSSVVPDGFVELEAVMSRHKYIVAIMALKDQDHWQIGWQV